ncbi:MAG: HRDC domain-containing protein, partial [Acidimicrobiia bacterium]|nr:HRDC domain-containing protein [Acidimicrobiia bacterium]
IHAFRDDELPDALTVKTSQGPDLAVEAAAVIRDWVDGGVPPSDIAVLARVNSSLIPVKAALVEAGIPTSDLLSGDAIRRTTLRALFAWMRMAMEPENLDRSDVLEAIRRPSRGLNTLAREMNIRRTSTIDDIAGLGVALDGKQAQRWAGFCDDIRSVAAVARGGSAADVIRSLVQDVGLASSARTLDAGRGNASRSGHTDDLVAVERAAAIHQDLADFLPWLADVVAAAPHDDGVTLSSVHRVKGMEWPRVVVFGADRGAWPHDLATDTEEERRVFHVALTRAIDQSVVFADESRPSRFLRELDGSAPLPKAVTPEPALLPKLGDEVRISGGYAGSVVGHDGDDVVVLLDRGVELTVHPAEVKEIVSGPGAEPDADLLESLKAWRLDTSKDRGVPAYVVFHDSTLEEIASRRPASERELLSIPGIGARKLEDYGDDLLALIESS